MMNWSRNTLVIKRTKDGPNSGLAGLAAYCLLVRAKRFHDGREIDEPFDPSGNIKCQDQHLETRNTTL